MSVDISGTDRSRSLHGSPSSFHPYHHHHHHITSTDLIDSMEKRTQRTYRYGIALVCIGAGLNWLGFAQGNNFIDPLRYLGVACVISGSFCVCLAMCRWLGRPISVSSHRVNSIDEDSLSGSHRTGDVHVINVSVPLYMADETGGRMKPPEYSIVAGEPPPYEEAIKLNPSALLLAPSHSHHNNYDNNLLLTANSGDSSNSNYVVCLMDQESSESEPLVTKQTPVSTAASPPPSYHTHHFENITTVVSSSENVTNNFTNASYNMVPDTHNTFVPASGTVANDIQVVGRNNTSSHENSTNSNNNNEDLEGNNNVIADNPGVSSSITENSNDSLEHQDMTSPCST